MKNTDDILGIDFEWYAVDAIGQMAMFTSAGSEYFPNVFFDNVGLRNNCWEILSPLPAMTSFRICNSDNGIINDWIKAAKAGFYAYDYDICGDSGHMLICSPDNPINVKSINVELSIPKYDGKFGDTCIDRNLVKLWPLVILRQ